MIRWGMAFLAASVAGCGQADVPEIYRGHVGPVQLAVPSRIAPSVLYDDESDWTPPDHPRSERTASDSIKEIEYFVDLDHPTELQEENYTNRVRFTQGAAMHHPAVFGHLLGVTALLGPDWKESPEHIRAMYNRHNPAFHAMRPSPATYGLEARQQDYSVPVPGRERHGLDKIDADYLSSSDGVYIQCDDAHMSVQPFEPMPTCHIWVIEKTMGARLMTDFDRIDLPRWRDLRSAMLHTLYSFRAVRDA